MDRLWILLVLPICGFCVGRELPSAGHAPSSRIVITGETVIIGPGPPLAIVGGTNAPEDAWPWQVLLLYRDRFLCGGTLLNTNTILTAAHCTHDRKNTRSYRVVVGEYNRIRKEKNRGEKKMAVKEIIEHPNYDNNNLYHDIAIMKLKRKVKFGTYIKPIPQLAGTAMDLMNRTCFVTGWGAVKGPFSSANILQELETPVVTNTDCQAGITLPYLVTDDMICTDSEPKNSCYGDSGGPLQCSVEGTWTQAGVVSWGNKKCRSGPSVYSRTSYHRDWIISYM